MAENNHPTDRKRDPKNNNNIYWIYVLVLAFFIFGALMWQNQAGSREISFPEFADYNSKGFVKDLVIVNKTQMEIYLTEEGIEYASKKSTDSNLKISANGPQFYLQTGSAETMDRYVMENKLSPKRVEKTEWGDVVQILIPIAILIALWFFFMRRVGGGAAGGQIFNIGKSRANLYDKENKVKVTFNDVAGLEEAKEEVQEVVEFLKNPQKFKKLGGHIPKGVLLVGPPGTGKTLLAKAVAGEAKVPFFSLSGSDFVEMFVGVGAARVRDLFKQAKEKAPCIIFIDEIDAVGRSRGRMNVTGGNDERENTLNQLLVEMDGFGSDTGVILMAATNRPDVLDPALLRAGRFDRQIGVDLPDIKGREAIFKVHLKQLTLSDAVDVKKLAAQTPGFVGADIMNVCNEAALIAARKEKNAVEMDDFQDAIDRVIGGLEKKSKIISPEEKRIVAYHEAGHAVSGWFLENAHPLVKVSIVPRGLAALGYAQYLPKEQYLRRYNELIDDMCMTLGGRAAEEIIFDEVSTGAMSDLKHITKVAYAMVTIYGMNSKVGQVSFQDGDEYNFTKPYSDATAKTIDEEVKKIIDDAYERTKKLLIEKREELEKIAQELLKKEVIFKEDMVRLIGERPFKEVNPYEIEPNKEEEKVVNPISENGSGNKEDSINIEVENGEV
ncbi:MAG: ATP-dependent zinc metalloprotease FtsH [Bacteroidetes bacterium]|nr:ATP-dependent zinc metalloprotease FtsH [Bacteroidota bacterium]MCB0843126.1 ATP-dependent zinc metalloprotease FtsH [Bacteroidota bacterium]